MEEKMEDIRPALFCIFILNMWCLALFYLSIDYNNGVLLSNIWLLQTTDNTLLERIREAKTVAKTEETCIMSEIELKAAFYGEFNYPVSSSCSRILKTERME